MRICLVNLWVLVLQLLLSGDIFPVSSSRMERTLLFPAEWESEEFESRFSVAEIKIFCKSSECSEYSKLERNEGSSYPESFRDITNEGLEFLSFEAHREHRLSVLTSTKIISWNQSKESEASDHLAEGRLVLFASIKQLETFTPSYAESASIYKHTLVVSALQFGNGRTNSSEILEIIAKYINLPPPVV